MASIIESQYVTGVFKKELKNRFLCTVSVEGEDVTCYIPSSCRLSNFLDLRGRTVLLKPNASPSTRTAYAVFAVKYRRGYILLNMGYANTVVENQLHRRYFSFLGKRKNVSHEVTIDDYKADLYIKDTQTIIEIKSILSFEKKAIFPSVYSERAVEQLRKLSVLLDKGYNVCYLFTSLNPQVKEIEANKSMEDFFEAFQECIRKGMMVRAFSIRLERDKPELYSNIRFCNESNFEQSIDHDHENETY